MNILNVLYTFQSGGVERLAIDVSNEFASNNHSAHLCIISQDYSGELLRQLSDEVKLHLLCRKERFRKMGYIHQLLRIIDKEHIDVVHVHQGTLMNFYLLLKMLRPKVRFYFTVHDTFIFSELSKKNRFLSKVVCRRLISISDAVTNDIAKNGVNRKKIVRVYNGVNFDNFPLRVARNSKRDQFEIVNVARFFPEKKGQDILINASAVLKEKGFNFHVTFAGGEISNKADAIPRMKQLANELGVDDCISFLGNVSNVPEVLKDADIFCLPSRYEGFGISAVEAMSTGLPCVASNISGLDEVVNEEFLGRVFPLGDSMALAEAIEYVIKHIDEYKSEVISENVRSRFSIRNMCKKLIDVYNA